MKILWSCFPDDYIYINTFVVKRFSAMMNGYHYEIFFVQCLLEARTHGKAYHRGANGSWEMGKFLSDPLERNEMN